MNIKDVKYKWYRMTPKEKISKYGEYSNHFYEVFYFKTYSGKDVFITYDKYAQLSIECDDEDIYSNVEFELNSVYTLYEIIHFMSKWYILFKINAETYQSCDYMFTFQYIGESIEEAIPSIFINDSIIFYMPDINSGPVKDLMDKYYDNMINSGFSREKVYNKARRIFLGF